MQALSAPPRRSTSVKSPPAFEPLSGTGEGPQRDVIFLSSKTAKATELSFAAFNPFLFPIFPIRLLALRKLVNLLFKRRLAMDNSAFSDCKAFICAEDGPRKLREDDARGGRGGLRDEVGEKVVMVVVVGG